MTLRPPADGASGALELVVDGRVVRREAWGSLTRDVPLRVEVPSQASSVSKVLVAVCALRLVDDGSLQLDDRVRRWCPELPEEWGGVEVGHLLEHSAGLPHWRDLPDVRIETDPPPPGRLVQLATARPPATPPGTHWSYSGVGYLLAAEVLERVAGVAYRELLEAAVVRPLRLVGTTSGVLPALRARGHRDGHAVAEVPGLTRLVGTGDLWSTVDDLCAVADALACGRLLAPARLAELCEPRHPTRTPDGFEHLVTVGYGRGVGTALLDGRRVHYHLGDNPGFLSVLAWCTAPRVAAAILLGDESAALAPLLEALLADGTSRAGTARRDATVPEGGS